MNRGAFLAAVFVGGISFGVVPSHADTLVTFENGSEGWRGGGIDPAIGNKPPAWHIGPALMDFLVFETSTNAEFLGDYSRSPRIELGFDVLAKHLGDSGYLVLEIHDAGVSRFDWASVYYYVDSGGGSEWTRTSIIIDDTSATEVPRNWSATSGVNTLGLPPGRTFASVLASVDVVRLSSLPPGWFVGDMSMHDVAFDNLFIRSLPKLGDADGDGYVNRLDVATVAASFGLDSTAPFDQGDFDGNGSIGLPDLTLLQAHLDESVAKSPIAGQAAVPEPTTVSLAVSILACLAVAARWRSRSPW
jgi:hypothetical protein